MRTSTLVLSVATATLATTTAWLAWELHERESATNTIMAARGREAQRETSPPSATAAKPPAQAATPRTPDAPTREQPDAAPASTPAVAAQRDLGKDPSVPFARQFLARYDDSAQRQVLLEEARTGVRRQYDALKDKLRLSNDEFEQLVDLVAQQNLQAQAQWAQCATDAGCDPQNPRRGMIDDRSQELLALLGPEHIDDFNRYRDTLGERDSVAQFRGRLSDAQFLPQAQAEQLITALADERQRYSQEAQQRGAHLKGFGTALGMVWYPSDAGSTDAQLAEALAYSQRMRARAATLLTPAQLAAFEQMQEELLAQLASLIRPQSNQPTTPKLARG